MEAPTESDAPPPDAAVLCVGESLVMLADPARRPLSRPGAELRTHVGGAESNVAMGLVRLGVPAAWWSRLGADPFGDLVADTIRAAGVRVMATRDPERPTGVYVKDTSRADSAVHYYRRGSAASALSAGDVALLPSAAPVVHVSGITAALSHSADAFLDALLEATVADGRTVSFDVNHRPSLWPADRAAPRLRELAARAPLVFVGLDEAERLWGTRTPAEVGALFPDAEVVVKDAERAAYVVQAGQVVTVPTPPTRVVEAVGAGDAFAAGYLASRWRGEPPPARLRAGHVCARHTLAVVGDNAALPSWDDLRAEAGALWRTDERGRSTLRSAAASRGSAAPR